jgi:hypothetical protein
MISTVEDVIKTRKIHSVVLKPMKNLPKDELDELLYNVNIDFQRNPVLPTIVASALRRGSTCNSYSERVVSMHFNCHMLHSNKNVYFAKFCCRSSN